MKFHTLICICACGLPNICLVAFNLQNIINILNEGTRNAMYAVYINTYDFVEYRRFNMFA